MRLVLPSYARANGIQRPNQYSNGDPAELKKLLPVLHGRAAEDTPIYLAGEDTVGKGGIERTAFILSQSCENFVRKVLLIDYD